ncbi:tyrosine-protein phosphatase [Gordonia bronchialis]|uniref:tyrosine-protein phosphatase n=1 Tax=Gordonia bronchialis TaxID=2054 RepID=UPI001CBE57D3|nr:tyrosine-protein phosphatase [Gordonia bronchialis]UAK39445.1 tyrosine-protein phosphatase [Gordonia bronchialis]
MEVSRIDVEGTFNLRDIGGYPVGAGQVRSGLVFRSDMPMVTESGMATIAALRLRTVVDLRDSREVDARPTRVASVVASVVSAGLDTTSIVRDSPEVTRTLGDLYCAIVDRRGERLARAIAALAAPNALPALVHCTAGKDRTGIVVALILSMMGVSSNDIGREYALTNENLTAEFFTMLDQSSIPHGHVDLTRLHRADPTAIVQMLDHVHRRYGSAMDYLVRYGADHEMLRGLIAILV